MITKPRRIPIGGDLVLKVAPYDLYNAAGEKILVTALQRFDMTFVCGGVEKKMQYIPTGGTSSGVSAVTPSTGDPYLVVCLCTDDFKPGDLVLKSVASIPDARFSMHNSVRKEPSEIPLMISLF